MIFLSNIVYFKFFNIHLINNIYYYSEIYFRNINIYSKKKQNSHIGQYDYYCYICKKFNNNDDAKTTTNKQTNKKIQVLSQQQQQNKTKRKER